VASLPRPKNNQAWVFTLFPGFFGPPNTTPGAVHAPAVDEDVDHTPHFYEPPCRTGPPGFSAGGRGGASVITHSLPTSLTPSTVAPALTLVPSHSAPVDPAWINRSIKPPPHYNPKEPWRTFLSTFETYLRLSVPKGYLTDEVRIDTLVSQCFTTDWQTQWNHQYANYLPEFGTPPLWPQFLDWARAQFISIDEGNACMAKFNTLTQPHGSSTTQVQAYFHGIVADVQATCGSSTVQVLSDLIQAHKWNSTCESGQIRAFSALNLPKLRDLIDYALLHPNPAWLVSTSYSHARTRLLTSLSPVSFMPLISQCYGTEPWSLNTLL
jgi:hypothetical protein